MTICSYDNSGQIKFDVDVEMEQGYWNTSSSRLWTKIRDYMHDDLVEIYKDMRQNGLSFENLMKYFYDDQISKIPQTYYNKDADIKYIPYADQYIGKAHGDGYQHLKRWLKRRITFCDTLFDYTPSYTNDILTIRANTTEEMTLEIETYSPVYQHLSWYNNQMDKKKIDGKTSVTFTGTAQASTDQEILIYGGSNIKAIRGISSTNPNQVLIGSATRLTEIDLSNCPILTTVNSDKANFTPHTYLNKLDISNCPQLGGILKANNSPLLREINAKNTAVTGIQLPPSIRNLEVLRLPNSISTLTLNDAGLLNTLEFDEGVNLQSITLTNCNNLTNCINFDLTKTPTVLLDNSYNAEELYMSETTDLTLKNMPTLKRVIYTPNNEYEEFDINNVINGKNYKVTTFNNPNMKEFITTAPHRLSYNNDIKFIEIPNKEIHDTANFKPGSINYTDGLADHSLDSTRGMSTLVPFTQAGSISYASSNSSIYLLGRCYDKDFIFLTANPTATWQSSGTWNVPSGTAYIRFVIKTSNDVIPSVDDINNLSVTLGNTTIQCIWNEDTSDDGYVLVKGENSTYIKDYGDITPNKVFSANTLDLSDTQFTDIKLLCTTDLYNLKVPTTMKNFYCDSAMDIDTEVVTDASYEVIHDELVEQYTTNYEGEVKRVIYSIKDMYADDFSNVQADANTLYWSDYIDVIPNSTFYITVPESNAYIFEGYDSNKTRVTTYMSWGTNYSGRYEFTSNNVQYIRGRVLKSAFTSKITLELPQLCTPNIIPSSASGSLIFNLYSNNTTQPISTSPYMWDLTGLKLNDFYTYGMNNWVKPNNGAIISVATEKVTIFPKNTWRGALGDTVILGTDNGSSFGAISPLKVKQGDSIKVNIQQSFKYAIIDNQGIILAETINTGTWSPIDTVVKITQENADRLLIQAYPNGSPVSEVYFNDITFYTNTLTLTGNATDNKATAFSLVVESMNGKNQLVNLESITMPQRLPGYSIRMVNADITPNNYANHLYPLLVDTTLPITGKLDYSKYKGTSLAWAYAYTTNDVAITPLGSQHMGGITNDYNKLYGTDYVDIVDVWAYKDDDFSNKSTNEAITKAYIELTSSNFSSRIDEVLQWYPNCTDLYLFDDGSVTSLDYMYSNGGHNNGHDTRKQAQNITFIEGYFNNLVSLANAFTSCINLVTVNNIPKTVTDFKSCFENCNKLNCQIDLSDYNVSDGRLGGIFYNNYELSYTPILPSNYTGSMYNTFRECRKLVEAPIIPNGVTTMGGTFQGCTSLTTAPNIPNSVTDMTGTFQSCSSLTTAPNIPDSVTNMYGTFYGCASLTTAPTIPNSVTNMETTFRGCTALTTVPNIPNSVTTIKNTFNGCTSLTTVPNIGDSVTDMYGTFYGCTSFTVIDATNWDTSNVTSMNSLFYGCDKLTEIKGIENWNTSKVTDVWDLFYGCGSIEYIDLSKWDMLQMSSIGCMYRYCASLKVAYLPIYQGNPNNALQGCRADLDVVWVGERNTDFDLSVYTHTNGFRAIDIQELVPEHLADLYKDTIKLDYSNTKININEEDSIYVESARYVEYIQGDGTNYIDIDIYANPQWKYELTRSGTDVSYGVVFDVGNFTRFRITDRYNSTLMYNNTAFNYDHDVGTDTSIYTVTIDKNKCYVNGELKATATETNDATQFTQGVRLFKTFQTRTDIYRVSVGRLYSFKMWDENGTLQFDGRPCLVNEKYPCIYDEVSKKYFFPKS